MMAKLDDITIGNYQVLTVNITRTYVPFYRNLATVYSNTEKGVGKVIREQQIRMADMLGLLARVEGRGATLVTRKELKNLEKLRTAWGEAHKQVSIWIKESIPFRKDSEKAIKDLGISSKDIKDLTSISKKVGLGKGGVIANLARSLGLPGIKSIVGAGAIMQFAGPMLGPLAAPGLAAGALLAGVSSKLLGRVSRRKKYPSISGKASGSLGAAIPGITGAPGVSGLAGMPGLAGTGVVEGMASTYPRDPLGKFLPRGGLTGIDNIEKGLFKFFNTRALKAKWTRRLLRAVEKKGTRDVGGLFGSFSKLKLLLPGLILALGKGVGLAGAVAFTAYQLHRAGKVAKEWWEVHKNVTESIKKQTKLQIGFLENLSDTLMKKARKAATEEDEETRKKAVMGVLEVQREIFEKKPKAGLWETWKQGAGAVIEDVKGIAKFKDGGLVTKPTLAVVGEVPEVITPLSAGSVMDVLKAIRENTAKGVGAAVAAPIDTFSPPFDLADPLLNQLNRTGSLSIG